MRELFESLTIRDLRDAAIVLLFGALFMWLGSIVLVEGHHVFDAWNERHATLNELFHEGHARYLMWGECAAGEIRTSHGQYAICVEAEALARAGLR